MPTTGEENIKIMQKLGCEVRGSGAITTNEAILCDRIAKLQEGYKLVVQSHEYGIVAAQSAYIAGVTESPEMAMVWLHNYLEGPGMIPPTLDMVAGAQAYSDKHSKLPG